MACEEPKSLIKLKITQILVVYTLPQEDEAEREM